jgi:hypothetical protein
MLTALLTAMGEEFGLEDRSRGLSGKLSKTGKRGCEVEELERGHPRIETR